MRAQIYRRPRRRRAKEDRGPDGMNKIERAMSVYLEMLRRTGEIAAWKFEPVTYFLAHRCTYTPDFGVWDGAGGPGATFPDRIIEVKGFWRGDARVKWKVAAALNPRTQFLAAKAIAWSTARQAPAAWEIEEYAKSKKRRWENI